MTAVPSTFFFTGKNQVSILWILSGEDSVLSRCANIVWKETVTELLERGRTQNNINQFVNWLIFH